MLNDLKEVIRQEIRPIDLSCWPVSWTILKKGLKTSSKKTVAIYQYHF